MTTQKKKAADRQSTALRPSFNRATITRTAPRSKSGILLTTTDTAIPRAIQLIHAANFQTADLRERCPYHHQRATIDALKEDLHIAVQVLINKLRADRRRHRSNLRRHRADRAA